MQGSEAAFDNAALGQQLFQFPIDVALFGQSFMQQPVDVIQIRQLPELVQIHMGGAELSREHVNR